MWDKISKLAPVEQFIFSIIIIVAVVVISHAIKWYFVSDPLHALVLCLIYFVIHIGGRGFLGMSRFWTIFLIALSCILYLGFIVGDILMLSLVSVTISCIFGTIEILAISLQPVFNKIRTSQQNREQSRKLEQLAIKAKQTIMQSRILLEQDGDPIDNFTAFISLLNANAQALVTFESARKQILALLDTFYTQYPKIKEQVDTSSLTTSNAIWDFNPYGTIQNILISPVPDSYKRQ